MMRLPQFRYAAPTEVGEAAKILEGEGPGAMPIAGGTDLLPNMKRKTQLPKTLVALRGIPSLTQISSDSRMVIGACTTLSDLVRHDSIGDLMRYAALNQGVDKLSSFGGFVPAAKGKPAPLRPEEFTRYSDEQLYALALFLYSLEPPPNPNPLDDAAKRGSEVFEGHRHAHRLSQIFEYVFELSTSLVSLFDTRLLYSAGSVVGS